MIALRFSTGEEGHAVAFTGEVLDVRAAGSHPVGQPLQVVLALPDGALTLDARSRGSRRLEDGWFEVRLRLVALRRTDRARLDAAFAG